MPAPAALIAALGLGALLLFSSSKKSTATPATATKPLDPNMPPAIDAKFKQALATITDPAVLDQLAGTADMAGYSNTAAALRARAAQLRGQIAIPGVSVPPPATTPAAVPGLPGGVAPPFAIPGFPGLPAIPGISAPAIPPGGPGVPPPMVPAVPGAPPPPPPPPTPVPIENLDPNIPPALAASVATLLAKPDWTDQELATADALANTLETTGFPIAAAKLRAKAMAIRASHAGAGLLGQITQILTTPPGQLPPVPSTPLPGTPPIITTPPVTPAGAPAPSAPLAKTYKVVSGDNPSKIAQVFTGSPQNFRQLAAANPDKSARILLGTIYVGEILTLPDAWPAKPQFAATAPAAPAPAPLGGAHATMQQGSTGPDVVLWQRIVGTSADGVFGPNTAASTRTWQAQHGLPADGVVGPASWAAAQSAASPAVAVPNAVPVPVIPAAVPVAASLLGPHATIQQGSSGPDVVLWQKVIGATPDGQFGPNTAAATKTWQSQHGLTADGVVGPKSWAAAQAAAVASVVTAPPVVVPAVPTIPAVATVPSSVTTHATIQQGSSGPDVVLWQKVIGVAPDGKFGPATAAATKTWQAQHGLTADGIVGPKTWTTALGSSAVAGWGPTYIVQANDTPFTIAHRFTGIGSRMFELAEANPEAAANIRNGIVFQGQSLRLPTSWNLAHGPASPASGLAGVLEIIGASHGRTTHGHHWGA
jgi:peptidoglycan hydrolase-like protein with peptidoglycan-binding domain